MAILNSSRTDGILFDKGTKGNIHQDTSHKLVPSHSSPEKISQLFHIKGRARYAQVLQSK